VHDAILIEAPLEQIQEALRIAQQSMADASSEVLAGPQWRSEATVIEYPDRFMDERGRRMWETVSLEQFQCAGGQARLTPESDKVSPRHRRGEKFLKEPIPLAWLCQAANT
jgi:hypothetical protein